MHPSAKRMNARTNPRRRALLGALGTAVMLPAAAQQPARLRRIGFLAATARPASLNEGNYGKFLQGLRELGYVEGKNIQIEWRFAEGRSERFAALAAELVQANVEVLLAATGSGVQAAIGATATIPIVMLLVGDAAKYGLVNRLNRPEGNVTGLTNISVEVAVKYVEFLRATIPKLRGIINLVTSGPGANAVFAKRVETAVKSVGLKYTLVQADDLEQVEKILRSMAKDRTEALIPSPEPFYSAQSKAISGLAIKYKIPTMFWTREHVVAGGLMSYGQNNAEHYHRAAAYVDKLLKGAKPADLPVEQPTKVELVVNGKTAKALGITLSGEIMLRAEEVIE